MFENVLTLFLGYGIILKIWAKNRIREETYMKTLLEKWNIFNENKNEKCDVFGVDSLFLMSGFNSASMYC